MKIDKLLQTSAVGLASFLALAFTANHAQALDFTISPPFSVGDFSATGTIRVDDAAIPSSPSNPLGLSDITDYTITISNPTAGTSETLIGGTAFGTDNSVLEDSNGGLTGTVTTSSLAINNFCLSESRIPNCDKDNEFTFVNNLASDSVNVAFAGMSDNATPTNNQQSIQGPIDLVATPVPFGVSTDLSLLILGSMWGASHLRKKMVAKS